MKLWKWLKKDKYRWIEWHLDRMSLTANEYLGYPGRMAYWSKSMGTATTIFNANIFNSKAEKVWFGDLEFGWWHDRVGLIRLAEEEGPIYVLREHAGRFLHKPPTPKYVRSMADVTIQKGVITYSPELERRIKELEELIKGQGSEKKE
jgi:hypothetical protein